MSVYAKFGRLLYVYTSRVAQEQETMGCDNRHETRFESGRHTSPLSDGYKTAQQRQQRLRWRASDGDGFAG